MRISTALLVLIVIGLGAFATATDFNYADALHKSILFYEAQRSGRLPASNHIPWRHDSALNDQGVDGEDLTGGWYDASDTVKFALPIASSVTLLAWGLIEFEEAYTDSTQYSNALDSVKWATDYLVKCHVSPDEFYAQVGGAQSDHTSWGRPEDMSVDRPAYKIDPSHPGSGVTGETAAALAAAAMVFKDRDSEYSETLLTHAKDLFNFAYIYRGLYSYSTSNGNDYYKSSDYIDELAYAAIWLYRASDEIKYYNYASQLYGDYEELSGTKLALDWDNKTPGFQLLMFLVTQEKMYQKDIVTYLNKWIQGEGDIKYTPGGLAWRAERGSLRYAANTAFLAAIACLERISESDSEDYQYCEFAKNQIDYMLGSSGRSYVVGFGVNPPDRPHHRASSCPDPPAICDWVDYINDGPNPHVLYGALVGGPDENDNFPNDRTDHVHDEVAVDYNAGFQSALAGVMQILKKNVLA